MQNNTSNNRIYNQLRQDYFEKKESEYKNIAGAPDKPCGGGHTDANSKTVAIRYMIENKLVPLHYES